MVHHHPPLINPGGNPASIVCLLSLPSTPSTYVHPSICHTPMSTYNSKTSILSLFVPSPYLVPSSHAWIQLHNNNNIKQAPSYHTNYLLISSLALLSSPCNVSSIAFFANCSDVTWSRRNIFYNNRLTSKPITWPHTSSQPHYAGALPCPWHVSSSVALELQLQRIFFQQQSWTVQWWWWHCSTCFLLIPIWRLIPVFQWRRFFPTPVV